MTGTSLVRPTVGLLPRQVWGLLALLALLTGGLTSLTLVRQAEEHMRTRLRARAELAVAGLESPRVRAVLAAPLDPDSIQYRMLKDHLERFKRVTPHSKFFYLMQRDGQGRVWFVADSEPEGSPDASAPGEFYPEASDSLHAVFRDGTPRVEGPVVDRWGHWVSGLAPLHDPATGEVLAVLGVDIDGDVWRAEVRRVGLLPLLLTGGVAGLFLLLALLHARWGARSGGRSRPALPPLLVLVVGAGLILTLFGTLVAHQMEEHRHCDQFRQWAASESKSLIGRLRAFEDIRLEAIGRFFEGSDHVDAGEFAQFTEFLAQDPVVDLWGWVPVVASAEREDFEQRLRSEGFVDFSIWELDEAGARTPTRQRLFHHPILYLAPSHRYTELIGYDTSSEPVRLAALQTALRTGFSIATDPVPPILGGDTSMMAIAYRPVFHPSGMRSPLGHVMARIRYDNLMELAIPGSTARTAPLNFQLYAIDAGGNTVLLAESQHERAMHAVAPTSLSSLRRHLELDVPVSWLGRAYLVFVDAGPGFLATNPPRAAAATGLIGLLLTTMLALFVGVQHQRREVLERLVEERTQVLRRSEGNLGATLDSIGDAVITTDPQGCVVRMNPVAEVLSGWSLEEARGRPIEEVLNLVEPGTDAPVPNPVRNALETGGTLSLTEAKTLRSRDGSEFQVSDTASPIRDEAGTLLGAVLVFADRSAETAARKELAASRLLLREVLDTVPVRVFWKDRHSKYMGANRAFLRDAGLESSEQIIGKDDFELCWREQAEAYRARDRQVIESGEPRLGFEEPQTTPAGETRWLRTSKVPLRDAAGNIIGVLGTYEDITEQKHNEEERDKLQARLLQAQKLESVGRLAGGVAHDFNNMLQTILGYTEMALDEAPEGNALREYLIEMQKAGNRSADLTHQLLAFARKQTVVPKVLNLNDTIENMLKMLRRLIGEDIDLLWKPAEGLWNVRIDPSQVDQILANLCVNARDAIAGVGNVTIETANFSCDAEWCASHTDAVPGEYVALTVTDDGCGMDRETLSRIFEPFFTTKELGHGTGLGLPTVYGIVRQNSGFITVSSEPGNGATFRVHLPRHDAPTSQGGAEDLSIALPTGTEAILLVEDEPGLLQLGVTLLSRLGYLVLPASSPRHALELVRRHQGALDLMITDVVMPEMNGRQLWEQVLRERPGIRCLFMSGYTADAIAHHGILDEGFHFLQKPFTLASLATKTRQVLDSPPTASPSVRSQ
jgi:PAS domain S-box-containing protein